MDSIIKDKEPTKAIYNEPLNITTEKLEARIGRVSQSRLKTRNHLKSLDTSTQEDQIDQLTLHYKG